MLGYPGPPPLGAPNLPKNTPPPPGPKKFRGGGSGFESERPPCCMRLSVESISQLIWRTKIHSFETMESIASFAVGSVHVFFLVISAHSSRLKI